MKALTAVVVTALLTFSACAFAQDVIPYGTILPVQLNSSLSLKAKPGQIITGRIMQDVPLSNGTKIREGSSVIGHVIMIAPGAEGAMARISFTFDHLAVSKQIIPITTNLRAIASFVEVESAQIPESGPDRGTPQDAWSTVQVGGDVVYRGGGPVMEGSRVVGTPAYDGVLSRVSSRSGTKCHGAIDANQQPQALWIFSSNACGTYGFSHIAVVHAGRSNPVGEIVLTSDRASLNIGSGSGMLLRVIAGSEKTR